MSIKRINVHSEGLNRYFGPLEAKIMELFWNRGELSVREVQSVLHEESPISVNAVMTVVNRLCEKGHLKKSAVGIGRVRGARFQPVQSMDEFLAEQMKAVSQGLVSEYGGLVVSHMIDALEEADPELIAQLEQKLAAMKLGRKP